MAEKKRAKREQEEEEKLDEVLKGTDGEQATATDPGDDDNFDETDFNDTR